MERVPVGNNKLNPGDTVYVKFGEIFRESKVVGTSGNTVRFRLFYPSSRKYGHIEEVPRERVYMVENDTTSSVDTANIDDTSKPTTAPTSDGGRRRSRRRKSKRTRRHSRR